MNLKEIRNELRKLAELADGWPSLQRIAPLERDLALEKLRMLYDTLRFGAGPAVLPPAGKAPRPAPAPAVTVVPPASPAAGEPRPIVRVEPVGYEDPDIEMVDLSEVLSLDEEEFVEMEPAEAPRPAAEEEEYGPEVIEFVPDEPAVGPTFSREPAHAAPAPEPAAPEPAPVAPKPAPAAPAPKPVQRPASQPARQPEPAPMQQPPRPLIIPQPQPQPAPAPAPQPQPQPQPAPRPAPAPVPEREPAAAPQAEETPSLFGPEDDATMAHRRKQRVIMSLYDPSPVEMPKAAAEPLPQESAEPAEPLSPADADAEIELLDAATGEPAASRADEPETQVLGEVINQDVHTLADTIAAPHASVRLGAPIDDLRQAIGINDKFLMIRDLFGGDSALFDSTVAALNAQQSLDDCMIYIAEHFAWNPESDSARLVMELLERKFA